MSSGRALTIPCTRRVCTPRRTPPARASAPCCCQTSVSICPCPVLAAPQPAVIPADDNPAVPEQDGQELPLQRASAASFVGACHHLLHTKGPRCWSCLCHTWGPHGRDPCPAPRGWGWWLAVVPGSTGTACRVGFAPSRSEQGMEQGSPPGFKHLILWLLIGFKWSRVHPGNLQLAPAQLAGEQRSRSSPSAQQRGWEEDQEKNGLVQTIQHQPPACCVPRDSWKGQPGLGWGSCSCTKGSITHGCTVPGVGAAVVVGPAARTPGVHCGASKERSCTASLPHPAPPCCPIHPLHARIWLLLGAGPSWKAGQPAQSPWRGWRGTPGAGCEAGWGGGSAHPITPSPLPVWEGWGPCAEG